MPKFYSLPADDTVLLDCDNVSCENLARLAHARLLSSIEPDALAGVTSFVVTISEATGQAVSYGGPL